MGRSLLARAHNRKISVTATTGLAATHLGGETIHRWSKIGVHETLTPSFFQKITAKERQRIIEMHILIIDEISMLADTQFEMINQVLQRVRMNQQPFGGIQVVMRGNRCCLSDIEVPVL